VSNAELFTSLLTRNCHHFSQELWTPGWRKKNTRKRFVTRQKLLQRVETEYIELGDNVVEMEKQLEEIVKNLKKEEEERMKPVRALLAEYEGHCLLKENGIISTIIQF